MPCGKSSQVVYRARATWSSTVVVSLVPFAVDDYTLGIEGEISSSEWSGTSMVLIRVPKIPPPTVFLSVVT